MQTAAESPRYSAGYPQRIMVKCHHCGAVMFRQPNVVKRAKYQFCSVACKRTNPDFTTYAAHRNGDVQRLRGEGRSYIKQYGRHQHRVVAEQKLGRPLLRGEIVHHIDGNMRNNAPDNLAVMTRSEHIAIHRKQGDLDRVKLA